MPETIASSQAEETWADYQDVFSRLGVADLVHLDMTERTDAQDEEQLAKLETCGGVFSQPID